ncbi:hypothetical protein C1926_20630 [Stenotrophomonas sp. ZAC14A_NAIMI4_1]|nr:hypothetical protein C1926_20630 [Stenotrophomonas sp. ZAC14A_NAIMI4_1]
MRAFFLDRSNCVEFRKEIEGLRGVAVLLVVLAHAGVPGFEGGYIGVDVFFVISGYLITGRLAQERADTGDISLMAFYARRARRLLAPLAVLLLVVAACTVHLLPMSAWQLQLDSLGWAALWASNVFFSNASFGYFSEGADTSLLLHTWSLGVEEQFYLIWPAVVLLLWRWRGRNALVVGCWLLVLAGFAAAVVAAEYASVSAYYQMPFRLWQLAAGAAVQLTFGARDGVARFTVLFHVLGAALLAVSAVFFVPEWISYPGAWALLPTLGASLLLLGGRDVLLQARPLRWFGRISYSLYLWHWPAITLAVACLGTSPAIRAGAAIAGIPVAWLSWRFIETPVLRRPIGDGRAWVAVFLTTAAVFAGTAHWSSWQIAKIELSAQQPPVLRTVALPALYSDPSCDEFYSASRVVPCRLVSQAEPGRPRVILAGDSVAAQWSTALSAIAVARGWDLTVITKSSCPMVDQSFVYAPIKRRYVECEQWRDGLVEYLHAHPADLLLLGSSAAYGFSPQEWEQGGSRLLARVAPTADQVLVLAPTPLLPFNASQCIQSVFSMNTAGTATGDSCSAALADVRPDEVTSRIGAAVATQPNARLIEVADMVCPDGLCRAEQGGMMHYRDGQHLNAAYVLSLAPALGDALDAATGHPAGK